MAETPTPRSLMTLTTPAVSTSTAAAAPSLPAGPRRAVRTKPQADALTAFPLLADATITLGNGYEEDARLGDWVISRGPVIMAVVSDQRFQAQYESVDDQALTLPGATRTQLERTLGLGATQSAPAFVTAVARLARLSIGCIEVDFTPGQWAELAARAAKRGITVEALMRQVVDKITADIWNVAAGA